MMVAIWTITRWLVGKLRLAADTSPSGRRDRAAGLSSANLLTNADLAATGATTLARAGRYAFALRGRGRIRPRVLKRSAS